MRLPSDVWELLARLPDDLKAFIWFDIILKNYGMLLELDLWREAYEVQPLIVASAIIGWYRLTPFGWERCEVGMNPLYHWVTEPMGRCMGCPQWTREYYDWCEVQPDFGIVFSPRGGLLYLSMLTVHQAAMCLLDNDMHCEWRAEQCTCLFDLSQ